MFQLVDLAWCDQSIGIDSKAEEFAIVRHFNPADLLVYQLLKQLKINAVQTGFAIEDEKLILLKNIPSTVEWVDETPRFTFPKQGIMNLKELFLIQKLQASISTNTLLELGVKWDKKQTFIFDLRMLEQVDENTEKFNKAYSNRLIKTLSDGNKEVLNERFKILLNEPFLNKLRTYYLFWLRKHQLDGGVPNWFEKLYTRQ